MEPITMMVASVGMQFFNNYANSKKNKVLQERQRAAQKAAAEHDFERARRLQAEAAKLALELEKETHEERVKDIEESYDTLLDNFAHSFTINNWPLNVLPFIMKGESFGSLVGGSAKSICMHCILTPSNCGWFNEYFYDDLDLRLEAEMNKNWNAQSSHPIVYYGGCWNRRKRSGRFTVAENIDLDDIELLHRKLKSIPTMVITPYFDPKLHFRVKLWGMGADNDAPFRIDIPQDDNDFGKRIFSYNYTKGEVPEESDDFFNTTMEEFVPYLECLIGFVADKYFWSMYSTAPQLPRLLANGENKTWLNNLYLPQYVEIADGVIQSETALRNDFVRATSIYKSLSDENIDIQHNLQNLHNRLISLAGGVEQMDLNDQTALKSIYSIANDPKLRTSIKSEIDFIEQNQEFVAWYCAGKNELYQRIINTSQTEDFVHSIFRIQYQDNNFAIGYFHYNSKPLITSDGNKFFLIKFSSSHQKGTFDIDDNVLSICQIPDVLFEHCPKYDKTQIENIFLSREILQHKLIETFTEGHQYFSSIIKDAPIKNVTLKKIFDWGDRNVGAFTSLRIVVAYDVQRELYCIIAEFEAADSKKHLPFMCNTLHYSFVEKLKNNSFILFKKTRQ